MTQIIPNSGGFAWSKTYVGPAGEVVSDSDNHDLILHDGATPGGKRFQNRDNADERYQGKSGELTGLSELPEDVKGFLFRSGTASYRVGEIKVNIANLTISNPDGSAGDPLISLAESIDSPHVWNAPQTFNDEVEFSAGASGAWTGTLEGDSAGKHTGPVEGNVTGNLTGDSEGTHVGSVDVRGADLFLDDGQIPADAVFGLIDALNSLVIPAGLIAMWSGAANAIPAGWSICDGTNGTPNLQDRFVIGRSESREAGTTGGTLTHAHGATIGASGAHAHGITVDNTTLTLDQIPAHFHLSGVTDDSATQNPFNRGIVPASPPGARGADDVSSPGVWEGKTESVGGGQAHSHGASSGTAGNHNHSATIQEADLLPPYFALCYIMKN